MELIRGLHNIQAQHHGCVLTIGKFDGVHLGHQAVLKNVQRTAQSLQLPAVVMVFEPQPEELFAPKHSPARLSPLREKYQSLQALGLERLLCVRFSVEFASQSPHDFIKHYLVDKLGIKFLVVGDDFRFGAGRAGDFSLLKREGEKYGFDVASTQSFCMDEHRISSTAIRTALANGDFSMANAMLGRPFSITGKVVKGEQNGRTIGFPTANILLKRQKSPVTGVFAIKAIYNGQSFKGVANVGKRPTLHGETMQLEAHLFDFNKDIYGDELQVEFMAKIRSEQKFADFQELSKQIVKDAEHAKRLLVNK